MRISDSEIQENWCKIATTNEAMNDGHLTDLKNLKLRCTLAYYALICIEDMTNNSKVKLKS